MGALTLTLWLTDLQSHSVTAGRGIYREDKLPKASSQRQKRADPSIVIQTEILSVAQKHTGQPTATAQTFCPSRRNYWWYIQFLNLILQQKGFPMLVWKNLAVLQSLDLNLIKHLWDEPGLIAQHQWPTSLMLLWLNGRKCLQNRFQNLGKWNLLKQHMNAQRFRRWFIIFSDFLLSTYFWPYSVSKKVHWIPQNKNTLYCL